MTSIFAFMYDESGLLGNDKSFNLSANDDSISLFYLTALFNSSLSKLWIWYNCPQLQGGTRKIREVYFENFPVPEINEEQNRIIGAHTKERITKWVRKCENHRRIERLNARKSACNR